MNKPQFPSGGDRRARWLKAAAGVWLLLASVLAAVNNVGLSRLAEQGRTHARGTDVQALGVRVGDLERQANALRRKPGSITRTEFDSDRQALDGRLALLEQAQAAEAGADGIGALEVLEARVGGIEARLKQATPETAPHRAVDAPNPTPKPKTPEPPFDVAGLELRGGERFVVVAAPGAARLGDLRLLRAGDAVGAWRLVTIEAGAAVFRVNGQTLRIELP